MYGVCRFPLRDIVKWIIYQAIPNPDSLQIVLINITGVIFIFSPQQIDKLRWSSSLSMSCVDKVGLLRLQKSQKAKV